MAGGKFTAKQRAACWERARGRCEVCGYRLPEKGWNLHHRAGRGMGGTRRQVTCADGLAVCGSGTTGCHGDLTSPNSHEMAQWAKDNGFVVSKFADAATVPVLTALFGWVLLTPDGTTEPAPMTEGVTQ